MSKLNEPAVLENEDGSKTIRLVEPVKHGQEMLEQITFKKPKAKHLKDLNLQNIKFDDFLKLGGAISGNPPSVMGELGMEDAFAMVEVISDFLPNSARDGKTD